MDSVSSDLTKRKGPSCVAIWFLCTVIFVLILVDIYLPCGDRDTAEDERPYGWVIVSNIQNEAPYLLEWIAWHRILGADHFFLYDDGSDDSLTEFLGPLVTSGLVTHIRMPQEDTKSGSDLRDDFQMRIRSTSWASHLDVDEFLFMGDIHKKFSDFLNEKRFIGAGGVKLLHRESGTAGRQTQIAGHDLASMTFLDLQNDAKMETGRTGKVILNVNMSTSGMLFRRKLSGSSGALLNIEGETASSGNRSVGRQVPFTGNAPFLIHHSTRSYEECVERDVMIRDQRSDANSEERISLCRQMHERSPKYAEHDFLKRPNTFTSEIQSKKAALCAEMNRLNAEYCGKVKCCGKENM